MKIKLKDIRIDGGTQSRELINESTVQEYTEALLNGSVFPSMDVFDDGVNMWLADGFHRYFMYKRADVKEVEVNIHKGLNRDAVLYSLSANDKHGLQRTNADKRKCVLVALNDIEWQELPDSKIAEMCRVSTAFVGKVRKANGIDRPAIKEVINKHGQKSTMDTSNIGRKSAKEEKPSDVATLKPLEALAEEFEDLTEDDHMAELAAVNEELAEENARLQGDAVAMSDDQEKIANEFAVLRSTIKALEAELRAVKSTSAEFQNKNNELIKQVSYWKKRAEKAEKALA